MAGPTVESLVAALPALAYEAKARASEAEALRRVPQDFAERLLRAGSVRVLIPAEFGGCDGSILDWWRMALALSTADASTGWVIGQCTMYCAVFAAKHPAARVRQVFADPLANVTGSGNGAGTAVPVEGGFRVTGRWRFTSGCTLATYVSGHPTVNGDSEPLGVAMFAPVSEITIHESWDVVGLAGTGSHDIEFRDVFVPHDLTNRPFDHHSEVQGALSSLAAGHWWDSCVAAAVALGIARHTLDEVWAVARAKPVSMLPGAPPRTSDSATLRTLQWCEGILFAQEAAMTEALALIWEKAAAGALELRDRVVVGTAAVTAVHESKRVADMAFEVATTEGLRNGHVLSRLIRDAQVMPLHAVARKGRFEILGRVAEGDSRLEPFI